MTTYPVPDPSRAYSGFWDPLASELTPRVQIDAVYGAVATDVEALLQGGGTVTEDSATFVLSSGTGVGDYAVIRSRRGCRYRPGQASRYRFTAAFSPTSDPAAFQLAGAFTATDGILVGQLGGVLGVLRRIPGRLAIHQLTLTVGSGGAETVTVTLDGVAFPVASGGALSTTALASRLAGQTFAGWTSAVSPTANGVAVTWIQSVPAATTGPFSLASTGTAAGTFATLSAGTPNSYADFRPQAEWNLDTLDGSADARNPSRAQIDPATLNVFEIEHTHLGAGPIVWRVLGPEGRWIDVHREIFWGLRTTSTQNNPSYRLGWAAARGSTAEAVEVRGASAAAFVAGGVQVLRNPFAVAVTGFSAGTTASVALALRVRGEFLSRANQRDVFLELLAASIETSSRAVRINVWLNPTPSAALSWSYLDQLTSVVEVATPAAGSITVTGGRLLTSIPVATGSGTQVRLDEMDLRLETGDEIVFTLATTTSTASCVLAVTHRED